MACNVGSLAEGLLHQVGECCSILRSADWVFSFTSICKTGDLKKIVTWQPAEGTFFRRYPPTWNKVLKFLKIFYLKNKNILGDGGGINLKKSGQIKNSPMVFTSEVVQWYPNNLMSKKHLSDYVCMENKYSHSNNFAPLSKLWGKTGLLHLREVPCIFEAQSVEQWFKILVLKHSLCFQFLNDLLNCILNSFFTLFIVFYFGFDSTFNIPSCRIIHPRFIERVNSAMGSVGYGATFKVYLAWWSPSDGSQQCS